MRACRRSLLLWGALVLLVPGMAGGAGETMRPAATIGKDTTWEGTVVVERPVTVLEGAVLTVKPGTIVSFATGAGLSADGVLIAKGGPDAPVRFVSARENPPPGDWKGIRFGGSSAGSTLSRCVILGAAGVEIAGPGIAIDDCEIRKGKAGLIVGAKSNPRIAGNALSDLAEGGVLCRPESSPVIERNVLRSCGPFGIACERSAVPVVRGNEISECGRGLAASGVIPPVEGNVFRKNGEGIAATSSGNRQVIRGNRFEENETGLLCELFSNPLVEGNTFTGNGVGLVCFRSSNPLVRNNDVSGNDLGIVCRQLSRPRIEGNEIRGNKIGVYLTLSSYAVVRGNNIHGNDVQMELGLMSSDWERRTAEKPLRGSAAQHANRANQAGRGTMAPDPGEGEATAVRPFVDAAGNWWGEKDTAEMERKGPDANIGGLVDYYDAPVHPSEGYPGVYEKDRIRYAGWKKDRIAGAGLPGRETPAEAGFEGKVVRDGAGVAGARVYAYKTFADVVAGRPFAATAPTPQDGSYRLGLPPGKYYLAAKRRNAGAEDGPPAAGDAFAFHGGNPVTVTPGKFARVGFSVVVLEKGTQYEEIADKATGTLTGVVAQDGKPAEGMGVLLYMDARQDFRGIPYAASPPTGPDGSFLFDSLPEADYFVLARKRSSGRGAGPLADGDTFGYYAANPVPVKAGKAARIRLGVISKTGGIARQDGPFGEKGTGVTGVIVDNDRKPVKGAYAFAYTEKSMTLRRPDHISLPADDEGRYAIHLPRGGKYFVGARTEYGDTPGPGEWYGRYEGTPDHSVLLSTGQVLGGIDIVVERILR